MNEQEYYYIDFNDLDIYSYPNENSALDKANKLIGNSFESFTDAKNALKKIIKNIKY